MARSTDSAHDNPTRSGKRKGDDISNSRNTRRRTNNESNPPPTDGSTHESDQIASKEEFSEQTKARDVFPGGVSVIEFLRRSFGAIPENLPLSNDGKKRAANALHGVKLRVTHEGRDKKFTFKGLSSVMTEDFRFFSKKSKFVFKYKKLPCLDLGESIELGESSYVPMEWCAVYGKDNPSNENVQRILSRETLQERHYKLQNQWLLLFLRIETPKAATITMFRQALASICGESRNDEIIHISDRADVEAKLATAEIKDIKILLCVVKKEDTTFYKTVKREAEVKKGILTQRCQLEQVDFYSDLFKHLRELEKSRYVADLASEMIAKAGVYREKAVLPHRALPPRFSDKIMYLGCNVINSSPRITVVVGNINGSVLDTCGYQSKVFRGDYTEELPNMLKELVNRYKKVNNESWPEKIIYFREGFMGGKHQDTRLREEVDALKEPTNALKKPTDALVTLIVPHKNKGCRSENGKVNYSPYMDQNGFYCSEFDTLIKNLCYSWRCSKPLPAYYADLAATSAKVYLEGNEKPDMPEIEAAVNKNLYVLGEHVSMDDENTQQQDRVMEQQQNEEMEE